MMSFYSPQTINVQVTRYFCLSVLRKQSEMDEEEVTVQEILAVLLLSIVAVMTMGMCYAGLALLILAFLKRTYRFHYSVSEENPSVKSPSEDSSNKVLDPQG